MSVYRTRTGAIRQPNIVRVSCNSKGALELREHTPYADQASDVRSILPDAQVAFPTGWAQTTEPWMDTSKVTLSLGIEVIEAE
jgi:hypothetical protein